MRRMFSGIPAVQREKWMICRRLAVLLVMLAAFFAASGLAESYPESQHPYAANSDVTWTYTHKEKAAALKITFSADTVLESNYDYLYVTDGNGIQQRFTGTALQGKDVYVLGGSFTLRLTSDSSTQKNGFKVIAVESAAQAEYDAYAAPRYTINSSGVITSYSGLAAEIEVPAKINGVTVTGIGRSVFTQNKQLTRVVLPDTLTSIEGYAFNGCSNLTNIVLPDGLISIGGMAFSGCSSLTEVSLPESLATIEQYAFPGCSSLTSIVWPESLTTIPIGCFKGCSSLTSVVLPKNLVSIEKYAFSDCSSLAGIDLPDGLKNIGREVFWGCTLLKEIEIPDSIEAMGDGCIPRDALIIFGSSEVAEAYACQYGHQYISDRKTAIDPGITDPDEKIRWIVANYTDPDMSEYEKALNLYDWLCSNVAYDSNYIINDVPSSELGVGGEAALIDGTAVCHGYTEAYQWLLEAVGIEAKYVTGYNHAWNIAKIDGEWYHFDATSDEGGGRHQFFGLSDMAMRAASKSIHSTQYTYRHLVCDSWEANYNYRNGDLDIALTSLRSFINENISAGIYSGTLTLDSRDVPASSEAIYTIVLILNSASDWAVAGRAEVKPNSNVSYSFVFYPNEELVTDIIVEGMDNLGDSRGNYCMYPGYEVQLNVSTLPQGRSVTFTSSKESVVTVSEEGLVTAVAPGSAYITLTSGNCSQAFNLYVENTRDPIETDCCYLDAGETSRVELDPWYDWFMTDTAAVWTSADKTIVTVDSAGLLTGVGYGKTTVTLTTAAGVTDTVTVCVRKPVTAVVFEQEVLETYIGNYPTLKVRLEGCDQNAYKEYFGKLTYTTSDGTIAKLYATFPPSWDEDTSCWVYLQCIQLLSPGEVTITAAARDGSGTVGTCRIIVHSESSLVLPAAVKTIDREAFLAAAAEEIVLPEGLERIGSRAFADSPALKRVNLPASLTSIAADAFEGSENVVLTCAEGSEGQRFAEAKGIPYVIR